ncbi:lytic transglycosylase [Fervidicella metallireducens AeB]|uniref:Lytic transglycosylase n=1 Tax=Fervidicella metallireducens AeB TaxID=1403537 RepID=A0A017RXT2_9CLOT|nr:lytic transglycosylase domain-containing protein [Fervidicella metallireducens]EYE89214.1 lytic transglycosylase [Fervidicella metallireducens AeB]
MKKVLSLIVILIFVFIAINYKIILKNFYPQHYKKYVYMYSKEYNLDPNLIFSFIKVESKFNPYAISNKNARGLMQITPKTGKYIASLLGEQDYSEEKLFEAQTNIKFGCYYISKLYKDFNGNMDCVIAAYNGGEGNVRKWVRNSTDKRLNIEEIPFNETRNYVIKIKANYKMYKMIYK